MNDSSNTITPEMFNSDLHRKYNYLRRVIIILSFIFILFVIWTVYDKYTYRGEMEEKYYKGLLELQKREKEFNKHVDSIVSTYKTYIRIKIPGGNYS